jgi:hypothetical protein
VDESGKKLKFTATADGLLLIKYHEEQSRPVYLKELSLDTGFNMKPNKGAIFFVYLANRHRFLLDKDR